MIGLGLALICSIFISFGCLVGAFRSLGSIAKSYDSESRIMAVMGFLGGLVLSAFFGWLTIFLLNRLQGISESIF
ncbi:MAG TPA: hypothetical protein ENN67_02510 [Firmicutes bacterium]|nr:hypothetical protein [Bacillota bacterium]